MDIEALYLIIDRIGVFVFALSGGLAAVRLRFDLFGVLLVSLLPAVGGGTLRDLLLDLPVFWLKDEPTLIFAALGGLAAFFAPSFWRKQAYLVWIDALGLALFAAAGAAKAHDAGHGFLVVMIMGTMTATFGGLIRDIVCNQLPALLQTEIYATAALSGAVSYWFVRQAGVDPSLSIAVAGGVTFCLRALAVRFDWHLPRSASG